jgi:hypothetical protein
MNRRTLKRKRSAVPKMPTSPIQGENTIVLYLSAHGYENQNVSTPLLKCSGSFIQTLSFAGHFGSLGMNEEVKNNEPSYDSASLAVIVNNYKTYLDLASGQQLDHSDIMEDTKEKIINNTKTSYKGLFESFTSLDAKNYTNAAPFQIIKHVDKERRYRFKPNPHEDCDINKCTNYGDDSCSTLPLLKRDCPFYGLSVVYADKQPDSPYSFAGVNNSNLNETDTTGNTYVSDQIYGNLNRNQPVQKYWRDRITSSLVPNKKQVILQIFDKLISNHEILLSEICALFNYLGYKNIFIYDPSCRQCDLTYSLIETDAVFIDKMNEINRINDLLPTLPDNTDSEKEKKKIQTDALKNMKKSIVGLRPVQRLSRRQSRYNANDPYSRKLREMRRSKLIRSELKKQKTPVKQKKRL